MPSTDEFGRIHERLDDLFGANAEIKGTLGRIEQRCLPCQVMLLAHQETIHGNGKEGLLVRVGAVESGRVDTLSVKSVCTLVGAIGALAATIGAAMGVMMR